MILTNGENYMNRQETIKLLTTIQTAYPNYKLPNKEIAVELWQEMLSEYTYQQVATALKAYIMADTSGFAPSIGQLVDRAQKIKQPNVLSEMEAWGLVSKALRNGYYNANEEFAKLPYTIQKAIGQPSQLRHWAETDLVTVETVIQSNFMRSYRIVLQNEQDVSKMPEDVKQLMKRNGLQIQQESRITIETKETVQTVHERVPMPESAKERLKSLFPGMN